MDAEQAYQFAVAGFFVVPAAISPEQVAELKAEAKQRGPLHTRDTPAVVHWSPAYRALIDNPKISPLLEEICGDRSPGWEHEDRSPGCPRPGFRLDHLNVHVGEEGRPSLTPQGGGLHGGNGFLRNPDGNRLLQYSASTPQPHPLSLPPAARILRRFSQRPTPKSWLRRLL